MKFFGVFLVICAFRACSSETTSDGAVKSPSHIVLRLASRKFLLCEGVLIGKNVAITAAGCVDKYKSVPNNLEVVAGVTSTDSIESEKTVQKRRIVEVLIHPDYQSSKKKQGDVAILKLSRPFKLTENVDIASYGDESAAKRIARLVGYGDDDRKSEKELKVVSTEDCKGYVKPEFKDGWVCAKLNHDDSEGYFYYAESSYAGAPLYYSDTDGNEVVVCGLSPSKSGVTYVDLGYYASWIEKNTDTSPIKTPPSTISSTTSTTETPTSTTK